MADYVSLHNRVYCPGIWLIFSSKITGKNWQSEGTRAELMSIFVSLKNFIHWWFQFSWKARISVHLPFWFDKTNKFKKKISKTKNVCNFMMASILNGWQQAFLNKYCPSSKILTETKNKALFTTQKPRIYVTIWQPSKNLVRKFLFPIGKLTSPKDGYVLHTL